MWLLDSGDCCCCGKQSKWGGLVGRNVFQEIAASYQSYYLSCVRTLLWDFTYVWISALPSTKGGRKTSSLAFFLDDPSVFPRKKLILSLIDDDDALREEFASSCFLRLLKNWLILEANFLGNINNLLLLSHSPNFWDGFCFQVTEEAAAVAAISYLQNRAIMSICSANNTSSSRTIISIAFGNAGFMSRHEGWFVDVEHGPFLSVECTIEKHKKWRPQSLKLPSLPSMNDISIIMKGTACISRWIDFE